jgi:glycosyltransferase involved in cell wall biosynthesis
VHVKPAPAIPFARYYYIARTVHLERMSTYTPAMLFYTRVRADFDHAAAAADPHVVRAGAVRTTLHVLSHGIRTLEMPEPLAVRIWPQLLFIHSVITVTNALRPRERRVRLVSYAIENLRPDEKLAAQLRLPRSLARSIVTAVAGFLTRTTSVMVFGTRAAEDVYRAAMPRAVRRPGLHTELVWALPNVMPPLEAETRSGPVVFLGTFEQRKGVFHLLEAWPEVLKRRPGSRLLIMGKGGEAARVRAFAAAHDSVELLEDPPRSVIFDRLHEAKTLVLHSQPTPVWKEQVGLPILEALASGCEIVSSDETGIADWLKDNGHEVLPVDASTTDLADAVVRSLKRERTPQEIGWPLPIEDSRAVADRILFAAR